MHADHAEDGVLGVDQLPRRGHDPLEQDRWAQTGGEQLVGVQQASQPGLAEGRRALRLE
jgi:hypothetical protein